MGFNSAFKGLNHTKLDILFKKKVVFIITTCERDVNSIYN